VTQATGEPEDSKTLARYRPEVLDWFNSSYDRTFSRHRSQADTSKLVVTFSLAVAATFVATALQVTGNWGLDVLATVILAIAFLITLNVVLSDKIMEPDPAWLAQQLLRDMRVDGVVAAISDLQSRTEERNQERLDDVRNTVTLQLILAFAASTVAAISLLLTTA